MRNPLVLANRPVEHDALARIFCCPAQRILTDTNRLHRDQHAFGIEAVKNVTETLAFIADTMRVRNEKSVDEQGVGIDGLASHLRDSAHLDLGAIEVRVED